ncbi:MAG: YihY/virulence factor BrkB family protein [Desulfonatronovibrio sp.]
MFKKLIVFIQNNIWRLDLGKLPKFQAFLVHHLRVLLVAVKGFTRDDCMPRASALTYYTLLSIVPVLAMAFGIAKGFGLEEALNKQLEYYLGTHEEILEQVVNFSYSLLEETRGGLVAGIGFIILLWSVIKVMTNIERSFNAVWGIKKGRGWIKKITEYISIMIIAPILIVLSGSMTVFISTELGALASDTRWLGFMGVVAGLIPLVLPYVLIWLLFIFLLMAMPNTRVKTKPAVTAGIISGTMFQIMQWGYITLQVGTVKYNAVYGSFAALPLFLIWLQFSWMIVLFGAELSFAYENVRKYIFATEIKNISPRYKQKVSLLILGMVIKRFLADGQATTPDQIQKELNPPPRLVNEIIQTLTRAELIVQISDPENNRPFYHPAKDINIMTISYVLKKLQTSGSSDIPISGGKAWDKISRAIEEFDKAVDSNPENVLLKDVYK